MKQYRKVNVLGTEYTIFVKNENEDPKLKENDGYCDTSTKTIVILEYEEDVMNKGNLDYYRKHVIRHELVHAFLGESGLEASANVFSSSWSQNEEMVDWISIQFPKILRAFQDADCI